MSPRKPLPHSKPEVEPLRLDRNDQSWSILHAIPAAMAVYDGPTPAPGYRGGRDCRETAQLLSLIAEHERVPMGNIRLIGSALPPIRELPNRLGCRKVVTLALDFIKYHDTARLWGLEHLSVPVALGEPVSAQLVANTVRDLGPAILFLTVPRLNPGGNLVVEEVIKAALAANPDLSIVLDAAYQRCEDPEVTKIDGISYAQFALLHPRVLYLQTANKSIGSLCAFKAGWVIGSAGLLSRLDRHVTDPYPIPGDGMARLIRFLRSPYVLAAMTNVQMSAHGQLVKALRSMHFSLLATKGVPWVLMDAGENAGSLDARLVEHGIYIQVQTIPALAGWLRVSATAPADVKRFICILRRVTAASHQRLAR